MNSLLVSVIVPVFRTREYIRRCAVSLFEQDFQDIEYLFIDDCSDDDSIRILRETLECYPKRKDCVQILRMNENSGISAVRNYGISIAKGKYLIHCDSDDWVDKDFISRLYHSAEESDSDIAVCDFYEEIDERVIYRYGKHSQTSDMASDALLLCASLWNKLVRTSIAQDERILHPNANCGEDMALIFQYALLSRSVSYVEKPLYHYCRNSNSILGVRTDDAILSRHKAILQNYELIADFQKRFDVVEKYQDQMVHLGLYVKNLLLPLLAKDKRYRKKWLSSCQAINGRILLSHSVTTREKLNAVVVIMGLYPLYGRYFK